MTKDFMTPAMDCFRLFADACPRQAGTLGVKNSKARNLHRLKCGVHFVVVLLERLCSAKTVTVREAAQEAYAKALQPIHNWAVQAAVQASLLTCPTREHFLTHIEETGG